MNYSGRCMGRLNEVIAEFWTTQKIHSSTYSENQIFYYGELVASYDWEDDTDIPKFKFSDKYSFLAQSYQEKKESILKNIGWSKLNKSTGKFENQK